MRGPDVRCPAGPPRRSLSALALAFSVLAAPVTVGAGPRPSFGPVTTLPAVPPGGSALAVGDVNRDGKLDLVVGSTGGTLAILLGRGTGSFATPMLIPLGVDAGDVVIGDFDRDGKPDLAVVGLAGVVILLGDGTGGFTALGPPFGDSSTSIAVGDFNRDGRLDLVTAGSASRAEICVYLATGPGTFTGASCFYSGGFLAGNYNVAVGDFDRDGIQDVALGTGDRPILTFRGDGAGAFAAQFELAMGAGPHRVAVGDLDGDGIPDLVVSIGSGVSVLRGLGNGQFGTPVAFQPGGRAPFAIADLNGDGKLDVALASGSPGHPGALIILVGDGTGSLAFATAVSLGASVPAALAVGDLDGDGRPDLVTVNADGTVSIALNTTAAAPTDFNGDGHADIVVGAGVGGGPHVRVFSGADGTELLSFFAFDPGFTGGVRVATCDLTGDGVPDIVVGPGPGGGPNVRVFDGKAGTPLPAPLGSFFAYDPGFTGGISVGCADVDGDGVPDVITGTGPGGGPHVRVFDGRTGAPLAAPSGSFFAYDPAFTGGVFVAP